jgi:membrane protein DedA with SNARE-associated domain
MMSVLIGSGIVREHPGKDIGHVDKDPSSRLSRWTRRRHVPRSHCGDVQLRVGASVSAALFLGVATPVHRHLHGPPIDYVGLAAAAGASWAGVPGPGEPVLIAAAVYAARHRLDITDVLIVAFVAAVAGGVVGWLIGMVGGRTLVTAPGPLRRARMSAVARGDEVFERHPVIAVLLTPAWVAGIHRVRTDLYMLLNLVGAAVWAAGIGLAAYWIGPSVIDFVGDVGIVTSVLLGALIAAMVIAEVMRRRRHRGERSA